MSLGKNAFAVSEFKLMGIWDHSYSNSVMDENVSTHCVNLPHNFLPTEMPKLSRDKQYDDLSWFDLEQVGSHLVEDDTVRFKDNYGQVTE